MGWRPATDQKVPGSEWMLVEKLGEGGFGEVWRARHGRLKQERVFKFCFRADRVRSFEREVTIFRILQDRVGTVTVHDVFLDEAPYYLVMEFVPGRDLRQWLTQMDKPISQEEKIALVAQNTFSLGQLGHMTFIALRANRHIYSCRIARM